MDPTTIMAIICSAVVFAGWLVLPASPAAVRTMAVSEERLAVPVSA